MIDQPNPLTFLTLLRVAEILQVSKRTVLRMIHQRKIPAFRVGGQWRIPESQFLKWVEEKMNTASESDPDSRQEKNGEIKQG